MRILWSVFGIMVPGWLVITHTVTSDWAVLGLLTLANVLGYLEGIFRD
jgi:hypothetical protein